MATSFTSRLKLGHPADGDLAWGDVVNNDLYAPLDVIQPLSGLAVTYHEGQTSTSLLVDVASGAFVTQDGTVHSYAGTTSYAIPTGTTKTLYLDGTAAWALTAAAAYPSTAHVRLATVVAGASTLTSVTDNRQSFVPAGTWYDGLVINVGTGTGLQLGSAIGQKLGFFGATPVTQPTSTADIVSGVLQPLGLCATGTHPATFGAITVTTLATAGNVTLSDGNNVVLGTSTGTAIGTATSQKLAFLGGTPATQQAAGADPITILATFGLKAAEGTPTIAAGAAAGVSPTVAITGTDRRGMISVTTGTAPTTGTLATITYSAVLSAAPKAILLTPANANAAGVTADYYANQANVTTAHFTADIATALAAATLYEFFYKVEG